MPYLALVHLRDCACAACGAPLARAGARSFVVGADGLPYAFEEGSVPESLIARILCPSGHACELRVPEDIAAEEAASTPDDAPVGTDALIKL